MISIANKEQTDINAAFLEDMCVPLRLKKFCFIPILPT